MDSTEVKIGDVVCNCNYQHLKVVGIQYDYSLRSYALVDTLFSYLPYRFYAFLHCILPKKITDATLALEDGGYYSARECCNVVPHDWVHPEEKELKN